MGYSKIKYGAIAATILLVLYIPSLLSWIFNDNIKTAIIYKGSVREYISADAWLIRDEELLVSDTSGKCIRNATEGDLVPVDFPVVTVLRESVEPLLDMLSSIDKEILDIKKADDLNQDLFMGDFLKINDEFTELVKQLVMMSNSRDLHSGALIKDKMNKLLKKKISSFGSMNPNNPRLAELEIQRSQVNSQLLDSTDEKRVTYAGNISYITDSLEEILKASDIENISIEHIKQAESIYNPERIQSGIVQAGKPYARIANGLDYYLAVILDDNKAYKLVEKNVYNVKLYDVDINILAELYSIKNNNNGTSLVIFKTNRSLAETIGYRKVSIDIVLGDYTGLKVPISSLIDHNEEMRTAKLAIVNAYRASFVDVHVDGFNHEYAIISNTDELIPTDADKVYLYSLYVIEPKNLEDGQEVN